MTSSTSHSHVISKMYSDLNIDKNSQTTTSQKWTPVKMTWENLLTYTSTQTFEFKSHDIIRMPNASGKSSILDIFLFALFDQSWRTNTRERIYLINKNAQSGWVELTFIVGCNQYTIKREIHRVGVINTVSLINEKGQVLNKLLSVNRKIVEMIGDMDTLLLTSILPQNYHNGYSLLTIPTASRRQLISTTMKIETRERVDKWFKTQLSTSNAKLDDIKTKLSRLNHIKTSPILLNKLEDSYIKVEDNIQFTTAELAELRKRYIETPHNIGLIIETYVNYQSELSNHNRIDYPKIIQQLKTQVMLNNCANNISRLFQYNEITTPPNITLHNNLLAELHLIKSYGLDGLDARIDILTALGRGDGPWSKVNLEIRTIASKHTTHKPMPNAQLQLDKILAEFERFNHISNWLSSHEQLIQCIQSGKTTVEEQIHIKSEISRLQTYLDFQTKRSGEILSEIKQSRAHNEYLLVIEADIVKLTEDKRQVDQSIDDIKSAKSTFVFPEANQLINNINGELEEFGGWKIDQIGGDFEITNPLNVPTKLLSGYEKLRGEIIIRHAISKYSLTPTCTLFIMDEPFDSVSDENIPGIHDIISKWDSIIFTSRRGPALPEPPA